MAFMGVQMKDSATELDGNDEVEITQPDQLLLLTNLPEKSAVVALYPVKPLPTDGALETWLANLGHLDADGTPGKLIERGVTVIIDVPRYQRPAQKISRELLGYFQERAPAFVKTLVRRGAHGAIAVVDGGQTWRACADARVMAPMKAQMWTSDKEDISLEFVLFSVTNTVQMVDADTRFRASVGETSDFFRKLNYNEKGELYGKLWEIETGKSNLLSATTQAHSFYKLYHADTTELEALRPIARALVRACDNEIIINASKREVAQKFMMEMLTISPNSRINTVYTQAIAHVKRAIKRRDFTPGEIKKIAAALAKAKAHGTRPDSGPLYAQKIEAYFRPNQIIGYACRLARHLGVPEEKLGFKA